MSPVGYFKKAKPRLLVVLVAVFASLAIKQLYDSAVPSDLTTRPNVAGGESVVQSTKIQPSYPPAMGDSTGATQMTVPKFTLPSLPPPVAKLGSESVRDALIRLGSAARKGSPQAAYDAFTIASFCAQREALATLVDQFGSNSQANSVESQGIKASHDRIVSVCGDVSPALLDERFAHIRVAAEGGVKNAADMYFTTGPRGIRPDLLQQLRDDPNVVAWRDASINMLTRDAQGGDVNAIARLANIYSEDMIVPKNLKNALAYQIVVAELQGQSNSANKQWLQAMQQRQVASMAQSLPESDRQAAQQMATELLKKCCNIDRRTS